MVKWLLILAGWFGFSAILGVFVGKAIHAGQEGDKPKQDRSQYNGHKRRETQ